MKRTKLNNLHKKLGAKMVDFAGYEMPVQYTSIVGEHKAVRESAGLFDVSHMGQIFVRGEEALSFVQLISTNDAARLTIGKVQYSAMCYEEGGIIDDLLIYKMADDEYMLVVNASNKEKDLEWMLKNKIPGISIDDESDTYSLIAIQGPASKDILQKLCNRELSIEYYNFFAAKVSDVDMIVSRTGYTGETGYELYFKGDETTAENVWDHLMKAGAEYDIQPAGLASRDSLRLEMGFTLYGNDIDSSTNPLEANLGWITKLNKEKFIGREALLDIKAKGVSRRLVGISTAEKCFPRKGYPVFSGGERIGEITSGTVSPVLDKPVALAYVQNEYSEIGTKIEVEIRKKLIPFNVVSIPFIKKS